MEKKLCKKCSKELADDSKNKLCEACQDKRKSIIKRILIGGAIGITAVSAAILAGLARIKGKDGNELDYSSDEDDFDEDEDDFDEDDFYEDDDFWGVPVGCRACGGDYPNCTTSCPMFD